MKTTDRIEQKVFAFIRQHHMLMPGDRIAAGISGGADSVCLLFVLQAWARQCPLSIEVVHVHHGIRREAEEDAAYVRQLCAESHLPFHLVRADVRTLAAREGRSEEEMGRLVRYEAFEQTCRETGADRIAVAHNSNDQAETMLFHLFRGSALAGLCGMYPVSGRVIRPLLCLTREEIEEYLLKKGIAYCTDQTNEGDDYTRNRIRHHILSYAEESVVRGAASHMAQTALLLQETEQYLEKQTGEAYRALVQEEGARRSAGGLTMPGRLVLSADGVGALEPVIRKRLIYRAITVLGGSARDISGVHVQDTETLFQKEGSRSVSLPYGITARRQYEKVILEAAGEDDRARRSLEREKKAAARGGRPEDCPQESGIWVETAKACKGEHIISVQEGLEFVFQIITGSDIRKKLENIPENQYTKWFDYDKMKELLKIRTRQQGDYLTIAGGGGQVFHKKLKNYMIEEKIPAGERDKVLLLTEGSHVIWAVGYRISEYYKTDRNTKRILQVQLRRSGQE